MCKYCKDGEPIVSGNRDNWFIYLMNKTFYLWHREPHIIGAKGIAIKYCPICGEELKVAKNIQE